MSGDWMKVELELPDKPEVHYIASALNLDADAVVGKLIRVWSWFDKHTEDGNALGVTYSLLDRITCVTGFAEQMALAGWLEQSGHKLTIPKFDRHNGKTAKNRALTAKRVAEHKVKSNANSNASIVSDALPREEKRREDIESTTLSGKPDVNPLKEKNQEEKEAAHRILSFLNEKTGRAYRPVPVNISMIVARLKEGATETQCRQIIAKKSREWSKDEKMNEYLRPATLFNNTKFNQYIGELVTHGD